MTSYVALLRAVNVGGTGKLPMTELRAMCEGCGFKDVRTYIASGNVVFTADPDEAAVQAKLEAALQAFAGKPVGVAVRTGPEMAAVLAANPFGEAAPNRTVAIFVKTPPPADLLQAVAGRGPTKAAARPTRLQVRPARKSPSAFERSTSTIPTVRRTRSSRYPPRVPGPRAT